MTLLTIAQNACKAVPLVAPSAIIGSSDATASLVLSCARRAGKALALAYDWPEMIFENTITTVSGTASYAPPAGFKSFMDGTVWDRANYWQMRGGLSARAWQIFKSSIFGSGLVLPRRWRMKENPSTKQLEVYIDPTPTANGDMLVYEYRSAYWCRSSGGTAQADWAADTDTGILDEYMLELETTWRLLSRSGLAYAEERQEAKDYAATVFAGEVGAGDLSLVPHWEDGHLIGVGNIPDTGYGP